MELLKLFLTFFEIGAVSFGGGYGMISLIREKVVGNGWLSEEELLNMIAVSESTPGPIAVNMATFVGSSQGGVLGAALATLGVVLPAFIIILIISTLIKNLLKFSGVQAFLSGVRPCVIGLILATSVNMFLSTVLGVSSFTALPDIDLKAIAILAILIAFAAVFKTLRSKKPSPILMIVISAGLGMLVYGIQ